MSALGFYRACKGLWGVNLVYFLDEQTLEARI